MLIDDLIIDAMAHQGWSVEADVARSLGVERVRLYQWKTHRRRCPTKHVTALAILARRDTTEALGQYAQEWETIKEHPELMGSR